MTKIEWCDHTFNPWIGCAKVSPACDHCYAETQAARFKMAEWGAHAPRTRTSAAYWKQPLKWGRQASVRRKVFCASMADVFDNHRSIDPQWRLDLWQLIRETPDIDWLLLTKRPQNIRKMLPPDWGNGWPNVWLGTTVENQQEAERRIPHLLDIPAAVRFVSCEPLLGPVDLTPYLPLSIGRIRAPSDIGELTEAELVERSESAARAALLSQDSAIDWAIAGGESGRDARPSHPDWFRSLRDQCAAADVPFFFKQWGDWLPWEWGSPPDLKSQNGGWMDSNTIPHDEAGELAKGWTDDCLYDGEDSCIHERVGKKLAGRLLDGRQHDEFPRQ